MEDGEFTVLGYNGMSVNFRLGDRQFGLSSEQVVSFLDGSSSNKLFSSTDLSGAISSYLTSIRGDEAALKKFRELQPQVYRRFQSSFSNVGDDVASIPWKKVRNGAILGAFALGGIVATIYGASTLRSPSYTPPSGEQMSAFLIQQQASLRGEQDLYEIGQILPTITTNDLTKEGLEAYNDLDARVRGGN